MKEQAVFPRVETPLQVQHDGTDEQGLLVILLPFHEFFQLFRVGGMVEGGCPHLFEHLVVCVIEVLLSFVFFRGASCTVLRQFFPQQVCRSGQMIEGGGLVRAAAIGRLCVQVPFVADVVEACRLVEQDESPACQAAVDAVLLRVRAALCHEREHHAVVLSYGFQLPAQVRVSGLEQDAPDAVQRVAHAARRKCFRGIAAKEFETSLVHKRQWIKKDVSVSPVYPGGIRLRRARNRRAVATSPFPAFRARA